MVAALQDTNGLQQAKKSSKTKRAAPSKAKGKGKAKKKKVEPVESTDEDEFNDESDNDDRSNYSYDKYDGPTGLDRLTEEANQDIGEEKTAVVDKEESFVVDEEENEENGKQHAQTEMIKPQSGLAVEDTNPQPKKPKAKVSFCFLVEIST
jgi:hypothetical protein